MSARTLVRLNVAFIVLLLLTCESPPPRAVRSGAGRSPRDTLRLNRDSMPMPDSATLAKAPPVQADSDRPCFASHFGLPCR